MKNITIFINMPDGQMISFFNITKLQFSKSDMGENYDRYVLINQSGYFVGCIPVSYLKHNLRKTRKESKCYITYSIDLKG